MSYWPCAITSNILIRISRARIECWGHRGASAAFPENTLASFEAAIRDGSEGIESDVHISLDDVIIMFHDPDLERTTNSTGKVKERKWFGPDGMEHVRTTKQPAQSIPTFPEVVSLLMKPENHHVKFNVDVKVFNDPERLFPLMQTIIAAYPEWETKLAPRIVLGLWHPRFLGPAKKYLPWCHRSHIGFSVDLARKWFWEDCQSFSINFMVLATSDGEKFREECRAAGKSVLTWTVNEPEHMMEVVRWDIVDAIMTDVPKVWLDLRSALSTDYENVSVRYKRTFLWTNPMFYPRVQAAVVKSRMRLFEQVGGPLDPNAPVNPEKLNKDSTSGGGGVAGWVLGVAMRVLGRS
ncbi:PLC-like phosphodiesterase [Stereum hirsutum FP-91666 SS1]|uniref:PLC-like phosphodiesterase n=1 Tax=Stereum hirsutum (strain FP-91666) TaxID=721885 RepID=UPI000440CB28|nr:PLC-like phosphodiesterase [Stereum hirsutum FP-91666 SS1]EIM89051.1 PLC-like phosphodiesterase [Stereum hirsutum FP-91666 SS1]